MQKRRRGVDFAEAGTAAGPEVALAHDESLRFGHFPTPSRALMCFVVRIPERWLADGIAWY